MKPRTLAGLLLLTAVLLIAGSASAIEVITELEDDTGDVQRTDEVTGAKTFTPADIDLVAAGTVFESADDLVNAIVIVSIFTTGPIINDHDQVVYSASINFDGHPSVGVDMVVEFSDDTLTFFDGGLLGGQIFPSDPSFDIPDARSLIITFVIARSVTGALSGDSGTLYASVDQRVIDVTLFDEVQPPVPEGGAGGEDDIQPIPGFEGVAVVGVLVIGAVVVRSRRISE